MSMKHSSTALQFLRRQHALKKDQQRRDATSFRSLLTGEKFGPDSFAIINNAKMPHYMYAEPTTGVPFV